MRGKWFSALALFGFITLLMSGRSVQEDGKRHTIQDPVTEGAFTLVILDVHPDRPLY